MSGILLEVFVGWSGSALGVLARVALVSLDQVGKKSSVAVQPRRLYITNISSWRLLISQVSIGGLCRGDQSGAANQWGHFILLERLLFDPQHWLVGLTPILWGFFFSCSVLWKGVGGEWWTLWCWQPAELLADVHGICARILLCSPFTAKNPQISLRGLIQICTLSTNFGTHNSITEIWSPKSFSTCKVSLDYLQCLSRSTCVICAKTVRDLCIPHGCWRFHRITELCSVQLKFEVVKANCTHNLSIFSKLTFASCFFTWFKGTLCVPGQWFPTWRSRAPKASQNKSEGLKDD